MSPSLWFGLPHCRWMLHIWPELAVPPQCPREQQELKKKINQSTVNDLVKHQKNKNILIFTVFLFYCSFLVNKSGNNLPVYHIYLLYMWLCWCVVLVLRRSHRMGSAAEPASGRCWRSSPSQSWTEQDQSGAPTACRRSSPPPGSPTPSLMLLF